MRLAAFTIPAMLSAAPVVAMAAPAWTVDKAHSSLAFTGSFSGQPFNGRFRQWDSRIVFDPQALAQSSVDVGIAMGSAATGDQSRDEALPTADWFATSIFPRANFAARQFKDLGGGRYLAIGTLTIRNIKRPVQLPFELRIAGKDAHMRGQLTIDRRIFGVGQGQFTTGDTVATAVRIEVDLTAHRN